MKILISIALLCMLFMPGCGYSVRYIVSKAFYQGGPGFDATPDDIGLAHVAVEFKNTDNDTLHGWVIPGKEHYPIILYFHGNMANVTHGLEKIELLNSLGFSIFSFEYRGYGQSEGRPLYEDDFYRDAHSALWWLHRMGWENTKIIFYGHSLGAAVALHLALEEPPVGVILESAFTSYAGMVKYKAPILYALGGRTAREFDNISKIAMLKRPIVLLHGTADVIVPPQMSQALYDSAKTSKRLYFINGAGHANALELAGESLAEKLEWFLPQNVSRRSVK